MRAFFKTLVGFFKVIYRPVLAVAHFIGKINSFIILTLFYFLFLGFARLSAFLSRKDLLDMRFKDRESYWKKRKDFKVSRESLLEPY